MFSRYLTAACLAVVFMSAAAFAESPGDNWPTWRGPDKNGISVNGNPPLTWSESENIKWKIDLPGNSSSTPIIWGDKLFIQTAVPAEEQAAQAEPSAPAETGRRRRGPPSVSPKGPLKFNVVCYDRTNGEKLWERTVREETPHEGHHPTGSHASYSPITDGKLLWASFGSRGLHCLDLDGNLKWSSELIQMRTRNRFGEGSSPALAGDAVVVLLDHEGDSKIMAFNKNTGDMIWERARKEATSWSTPFIVEVDGVNQVITSATDRIRSYDAKTGEIIWECDGVTLNAISTPVVGFGNVYCTSGFRGFSLKAIELGHTGDLTNTKAIKWEIDRGTPYIASPLLYDDRIYVTAERRAILSCYDAKTGEPFFEEERLPGLGTLYASPVGAAGRVYIADRTGNVMVIEKADTLKILGTNKLDDVFDASPVIIGDIMYLKGLKHLYCITES